MSELYQYQQDAVAHLRRWKVGALFMEAGTGKTRVAVELANGVADLDAILWVGPLRTIGEGKSSVKHEINKCGGFRAAVKFVGIESLSQSMRIFFETLHYLEAYKNRMIIVDESLKIKNGNAKRTRMLFQLAQYSEYRLILNGTPITRNVSDMWAQMEFLSPLILKMDYAEYVNTFCEQTKITKRIGSWKQEKTIITGYSNIDYLYSLIRPYIFEASLSLKVDDYYREIDYLLTDEEREAYLDLKQYYLNKAIDDWHTPLLEMLQALQHNYCCAAGKLEAVNKIFQEIPQDKTIIFCKYIDSANFCREKIPKAEILTYGKNSFGLNMQDYHYTIYWDKTWDLAQRLQSTRRTFRTGQEHDCTFYDLTANVGLDKMIDKNISRKSDMLEYMKKKTKEDILKEL